LVGQVTPGAPDVELKSITVHRGAGIILDEAGAFQIPGKIFPSRRVKGHRGRILVDHAGIFGSPAEPFLDLGMAIGKGETTGAVVIRGGQVLPGGGRRIVHEVTIVDRVGMFINHQPGSARARHLGLLEELFELGEPPISALMHALGRGIGPRAEPAKNGIHGQAAVALAVAGGGLVRAEIFVGGTFVGADRAAEIFSQHAVLHPGVIGVADVRSGQGGAPGHDVVDPVVENIPRDGSDGFVHAVIVGHAVIGVARIEMPRQRDLLGVVQTADALRLGLRLGEGRQKHGREDGDDGNNHQEFDQREGARASGRGRTGGAGLKLDGRFGLHNAMAVVELIKQ
jgi:hypothetical protein